MGKKGFGDKIREYIEDEWSDAAYYRLLANLCPNPSLKQILLEFSQEETKHAAQLQAYYRKISGRQYSKKEQGEYRFEPEFSANMRLRVEHEMLDYRRYNSQSLELGCRHCRDFFSRLSADEMVHATRLLNLL